MSGPSADQTADSAADCAFVADLAEPFVLHALEMNEAEQMERHLRLCPNCVRLIDELRRAVSLLPLLSPAATPPPDVKAALFARISQVERADVGTWSEIPDRLQRGRDRRRPWQAGGWLWPVMTSPAVTAPLVLILALVGGWTVLLQDRMDDAAARNTELQQEMSDLSHAVAVQDTLPLRYDSRPPTASEPFGRLLAGAGEATAVLVLWNLDPSVPYEAWSVDRNGQMETVGDVQVMHDGTGWSLLALDRAIDEYDRIYVCRDGTAPGNGASELWLRVGPGPETGTGAMLSIGDDAPNLGQRLAAPTSEP